MSKASKAVESVDEKEAVESASTTWKELPRVSLKRDERALLREVREQVATIRDSKKGVVRTELTRIVRYCDRLNKGVRVGDRS